jgi:hypothetical protein
MYLSENVIHLNFNSQHLFTLYLYFIFIMLELIKVDTYVNKLINLCHDTHLELATVVSVSALSWTFGWNVLHGHMYICLNSCRWFFSYLYYILFYVTSGAQI